MLNTSTGKLYTLLSACKPNNEKIKKRLLILEITETEEYKALQVYQGAQSIMDDYYSPARLQERSYDELLEIKQIIPFLEGCIRKLYEVVCYGDVRKLPKLEEKDYYQASKMKEFHNTVTSIPKEGINITNIPEYDMWKVFSPDIILSIDQRLDEFASYDIDSLEMAIPDILEADTYCISASEIADQRKAYKDIYRREETLRLRFQIVENKVFMKKLILSILSLPMVVGISIPILSPIERIIQLLIYMVGLSVFWILG